MMSGLPSPLTSATATESGANPVAKFTAAAKVGAAPGVVVFSSTDTVSSPLLTTTRSGLPSPLTSAIATETGDNPVAAVLWVAKATGGPMTLVIPVSWTEKV